MRTMTRHIALASLLSLAIVELADGRAPQEPSRATAQSTTIVGCLVQHPSPKADEFFVRTPAIAVPAGTPIAVGEPGAAAGSTRATTSAGTPTATTLYRVTGLTAAELKPHLNHRVELQGRVSRNTPPPTTATTTQDPKTGRATTSVKEDWTVAGIVEASTLKMVAATCQ
jgi:hypothetical protein